MSEAAARLLPSLARRSDEAERMDVEPVAADDLARALADLEWLAAIGLSHRPMLAWLDRLAEGRRALRVMDVASGGGDMLRRIARWGRRRGIALELEGVDANPDACAVAAARSEAWMPIAYRCADALALPPEPRPDVIVSSHFAHHLGDGELVRFLSWMEATARVGWYVNDLHRHPLMLLGVGRIARAARLHRFVVADGPVSVRRSFVRADWERALTAARIPRGRVELRWHLPFRWGVGTRPA